MNQTAPTKRRTRTLILWILLSVILLALVCAAVWFFMGCPPGIPARKTAVLCYDDPSTSADPWRSPSPRRRPAWSANI